MPKSFLTLGALASGLFAQTPAELREILDRLERLEAQNRELLAEIRALERRVASETALAEPAAIENAAEIAAAPLPERMAVAEQRLAELDQVKITAENRLPVSLTGMLLFNSYFNGKASGGEQYPLIASPEGRAGSAGGTLRQSVVGLRLDGPRVLGGGKVDGAVFADFFGGGTGLDQTVRLRVARLNVSWRSATLGFAFDKPLIARRDPDSLAQVGVSPLTGAGNLWLWRPQVWFEHRLNWAERSGLNLQASLYQTSEEGTGLAGFYGDSLAPSRPGYEGRVEFWAAGGGRRLEIAPGFHASSSRVIGQSVPSRIFSVDWLIRPAARVDFTGTFFSGENTGVIGGLRQGASVFDGKARAVRSMGGWAQLKVRLSPRLDVNAFGGQQDDRNRDLYQRGVLKNQSYGGNVMFRWGSNIMTSFEASQVRSTYRGTGQRVNPHYDLAIAYLF
jgi:hypothetical protein